VRTRVIHFQGNEWRKRALLLVVGKHATINQANKEEKVLVGGGEAFDLGFVLRRRLEL
jgi:peptidase E